MPVAATNDPSHHVRSILVIDLFGRYKYRLPGPGQQMSSLNIVYGENGVGKTTLLTLVFNLISSADNQGHKTRISETPFSYLEVVLADGTKLTAEKDKQLLTGPVQFTIESSSRPRVQWRLIPGPNDPKFSIQDLPSNIDVKRLAPDIRKEVQYAIGKRDYFAELAKLKLTTFMLTSDRMLLGTKLQDSNRAERMLDVAKARGRLADLVREYRSLAVKDALGVASEWLQQKFVERSYGTRFSVDPYQDVVNKIASTTYKTRSGLNKSQETSILTGLRAKVEDLNRKSAQLAEFGIAGTSFPAELLSTVERTQGNKLNLINNILLPYLDGQQARLSTLTPIYELTTNFVKTVNRFLRDKRMTYSVTRGLQIIVEDKAGALQHIEPSQLSSGEQQLLLLLCHVLVAQDTSSLIIIDEPEISLNVLWQRTLISSLQTLSKGSSIQFLFASHSLELLSKHRNRVIAMEEQS